MTYVFDIDNTICITSDNGDDKYEKSKPIIERIEKVNKLYDQGNKIIYLTARGMGTFNNDQKKAIEKYYEFTKKQLDGWGCKYNYLFLGKPSADFYIDDKGINDEEFFRN